MKKILTSILLLSALAVCADDFGMTIPQWKDFAPSAFVDVKEPKGFGKLNVTAKYWYERRLAFDEGIEECKAMETYEQRFSCFEDLKSKQFRENTDYNARIEAQQQSMSGIPEMQNRTDTMLPVNMFGGYANMIPNELRGY